MVLKRAPAPTAWLEWEERFCREVVDDGFRLQRLRRAGDGRIEVDGWIARDFLVGDHTSGAWEVRMLVAEAFLRALADATSAGPGVPAEARTDAWALADRMTWEEMPIPTDMMADASVTELARARRPVHAARQVIHGDLTGNVLFHVALPPAIIDFSPYVRPAGYGLAVLAADAVIWHAADLDIARSVMRLPDGRQLLLRAMLFRHATAMLLGRRQPAGAAAERYAVLRQATLEQIS